MNVIAAVVSPTLLAVFASLSLGIGALLFVVSRRGGTGIDLRVPLSWSEPAELRVILYLILGAVSSALALVLRLVLVLPAEGSFLAWLLLALTILGLLLTLAFFYAAMGSLLQAAFGTRGRPPFWFWRFLSPIDGAIMNLGDVLSAALFHPAPSRERPVRSRRREFDDEYAELDYDEVVPRRPRPRPRATAGPSGPVRRRHPVEQYEEPEEYRYDEETPVRRPARPASTSRRPAPPVMEADDEELDYDVDDGSSRRQTRATPSREPRDVVKDRIELALEEYEAALTLSQLEKLREMRRLVESLKQVT